MNGSYKRMEAGIGVRNVSLNYRSLISCILFIIIICIMTIVLSREASGSTSDWNEVTNRTIPLKDGVNYDKEYFRGRPGEDLEIDLDVIDGGPVDVYIISDDELDEYRNGRDFSPLNAWENTLRSMTPTE